MKRRYSFPPEEASKTEPVLQSERASDRVSGSNRPLREAHGFDDGAGDERQGWTEVQNRGQRLCEHKKTDRQLILSPYWTSGNP